MSMALILAFIRHFCFTSSFVVITHHSHRSQPSSTLFSFVTVIRRSHTPPENDCWISWALHNVPATQRRTLQCPVLDLNILSSSYHFFHSTGTLWACNCHLNRISFNAWALSTFILDSLLTACLLFSLCINPTTMCKTNEKWKYELTHCPCRCWNCIEINESMHWNKRMEQNIEIRYISINNQHHMNPPMDITMQDGCWPMVWLDASCLLHHQFNYFFC